MPTPPLWLSTQDLANAVHAMAEAAALDPLEREAALVILGEIIGEGETSHVRCLRRVAEIIENDRPRLLEIAAARASHSPRSVWKETGPKPAEQETIRWDLSQ